MDSLDHLLIATANTILPTLSPIQLQQRFARRNNPTLTRPPRPWCIALKAADKRIAPPNAILYETNCGAGVPPADANQSRITNHVSRLTPHTLSPTTPLPKNPETGQLPTHTVLITQPLIELLCTPVIVQPYTDHRKVAAELGVHPGSLAHARKKGFYELKFIKGLSGRRGKPVPCLYTREDLDPNSASFHRPPDPLWGGCWYHFHCFLDDDFHQPILRRPVFHVASDRLRFAGLHWQCPGCEKLVRTLYLPIPRPTLSHALNLFPVSEDLAPLPESPRTFACHNCHRVRFFSSTNPREYWNQFIAYASDGLLFGHEVPKPAWYKPNRLRPKKPRLGRPPSQRRQQILPLLLQRQTDKEIAAKLDIQPGTVRKYIKAIYKLNEVTNLPALAKKLNHTLPPRRSPKQEQIIRLRTQGQTRAQIAKKLHITLSAINHHIKNHNKQTRHHPPTPT